MLGVWAIRNQKNYRPTKHFQDRIYVTIFLLKGPSCVLPKICRNHFITKMWFKVPNNEVKHNKAPNRNVYH